MEDWEDEPILPPLKKEQLKNRWDDEDVDENDVKDSWEDEEETALAAKTTAKSIVDMQNVVEEDSEFSEEDDMEGSAVQGESEDENDKRCKAALDKLEKASEDTILGQACHKYKNLNKLYLGFAFSWISKVHNFLIHTPHICLQRSFVL
ncbi:hypothetical protein ACSBR2_033465 [Camellia fascicularis]